MIDEVVDVVSGDVIGVGDTAFVANAGTAYCDGLMALARGATIDVVDVATQATRRRFPCDAKAAVLAWGPGRRLACGTPGLARVFVDDRVSEAPLEGRVTAAAFASSFVAFCTVKACTVFEDDQLQTRLCDLPGVWRGCAFARDALCAVADAGALVWERGEGSMVVDGTAGARCAAALDAAFVVACDARLNVVAPVATPAALAIVERRGEVSYSGFGGGVIPPFLMLGAETAPPPGLAHILIVARGNDEASTTWTVVRKVRVDALGPDTKLLDLLAVSDASIFVASSFARKIARFDAATLAPSAVVQLPTHIPDSATGSTRLRGLAPAQPGTCCAVLADAAVGGPSNSSSSPTRAFVIFDIFASPSRAPPPATVEPTTPDTHQGEDGESLAALRAHVDRRFDALEAKIDRLLLALGPQAGQ